MSTSFHAPDIDPLVDFYDRRLFDDFLSKELNRAARHGSTTTLVRAALSPELGEDMLRAWTYACLASIRGYDFIFRLAEREFALLLPDSDRLGGQMVVDRIEETLKDKIEEQGVDAVLKLEIGIATFPFDAETAVALCEAAAADRRIYPSELN
jgi:diguanylate cyclase (GGDEF)-like protein